MKPIRVEEIPPRGLKLNFPVEETWLQDRAAETPLGFDAEGPLRVTGELNKISQGILFRGQVRGRIKLTCGRCLENFSQELEQKVEAQWRLIPAPFGTAQSEKDPAGRIEDLESGDIQEGGLNLAERILEDVILALPIQPLCRTSCQGLCPTCGANRNDFPCVCKPDRPSQPFSALKDAKIETEGKP
jgi:DUF177 domain-containing protein